jgi:ribosome-binding protein aMBF1 (putative translation factor)
MISAITTTHAIPQKLLPARIHVARARLTICQHCFQILGTAQSVADRRAMEAEHICKEKLNDRQPAAALPFS